MIDGSSGSAALNVLSNPGESLGSFFGILPVSAEPPGAAITKPFQRIQSRFVWM